MQVLTNKDRVFWCLNRYWCTYYIVDGYVVGLWWSAIPRLWCPTSDLFMDPKRMNQGIKRIYCVKSQVTTPTKKKRKDWHHIFFFLMPVSFVCSSYPTENHGLKMRTFKRISCRSLKQPLSPQKGDRSCSVMDRLIWIHTLKYLPKPEKIHLYLQLFFDYFYVRTISTAPPEADTCTPVLQ